VLVQEASDALEVESGVASARGLAQNEPVGRMTPYDASPEGHLYGLINQFDNLKGYFHEQQAE
jgi:hypothetical protein